MRIPDSSCHYPFMSFFCATSGIRDVYICSGSADPFGALAFRASAGAALSANVYFGDEAVLKVSNHLKTNRSSQGGTGGVALLQIYSLWSDLIFNFRRLSRLILSCVRRRMLQRARCNGLRQSWGRHRNPGF